MFIRDELKNRGVSEIRQMINSAPKDAINLGLGEIQFPMHQKIKDYITTLIKTDNFFYTQNAGLPNLRKQISGYYQNIVPKENICVTVGAEEAVFATLFSILNKGDEVLISNPGYLAYKTIVELCMGKPIYFDRNKDDGFIIDKNSLKKAISPKTKAIIISNPSNPLGIKLSDGELAFFKEIANKNNILLIIDEIYRDLSLREAIKTALDDSKNVVVISGISKAFAMSGWRLGWAISSNENLIRSIITAHQYIATCAPYISQKIAERLLSEKDYFLNYYLEKLKKNYFHTMDFFQSNFSDAKVIVPDSAPYLFINFGYDDKSFANELLQRGVIVIPGSAFGENGSGWIRINYATPEDKLDKALSLIYDNIFKR